MGSKRKSSQLKWVNLNKKISGVANDWTCDSLFMHADNNDFLGLQ